MTPDVATALAADLDPEPRINAIVSDLGGVLTIPLLDAFRAYEQSSGIPLSELGKAMAGIGAEDGSNPLFELESGRITAAEFLGRLSAQLTRQLGREVSMAGFGEVYFEHLEPNERMLAFMRDLKARGYRMALCTNNAAEWQPLWRPKLGIDAIFSVVIDSGVVGMRKPDPGIYELTLRQLGVPPEAAVLIDDIDVNCAAARELGMSAIQFRSTDQAVADVELRLA
jgi:epoxide hydrolase-like predicted phosphatase